MSHKQRTKVRHTQNTYYENAKQGQLHAKAKHALLVWKDNNWATVTQHLERNPSNAQEPPPTVSL